MKHSIQSIKLLLIAMLAFTTLTLHAQDTAEYKLRLDIPLVDIPQNTSQPYRYPSMKQALAAAGDMYDVGFWAIDALGNKVLNPNSIVQGKKYKIMNMAFKYVAGLAFAKWGSELPIPLGVWAHEEFHRSVMGVKGIDSKNGNWIFNRWDGSVYGVSDSSISRLKATDINQLAYAYVAGIQSEVALNKSITINDFYKKRSLNKTALLLYNAWYIRHYFSGAVSPASDSAKKYIPKHESGNPLLRDFAGDDLTAWAYDIFSPDSAYIKRPAFPGGSGVNRRIGFSDLSPQAQAFLKKQKNLSLLNFLNPAIFFINRIKILPQLSFTVFAQYAPTHFGNDISLYLPLQYRNWDILVATHNYKGLNSRGHGYELGVLNHKVARQLETNLILHFWQQPESFYSAKLKTGFAVDAGIHYNVNKQLAFYTSLQQKTAGWLMGSPYLGNNISAQAGIRFTIAKK